jgi:toxin ParE1/3/4
MARLSWTLPARDDLREIRRYIARDSHARAQAMVSEIRRAAERLRDFPESGRMVPEYDDPAYHEIIVRSYRVLYRYTAATNAVEVLPVIHGRRLLPPLSDDD